MQTHTHVAHAVRTCLIGRDGREERGRTLKEQLLGLQCTEAGLRSAPCGSEVDRSPSRLPAPPRLAVQVISQESTIALPRRSDVRGAAFSAAMSCNPEVHQSSQCLVGYRRCAIVINAVRLSSTKQQHYQEHPGALSRLVHHGSNSQGRDYTDSWIKIAGRSLILTDQWVHSTTPRTLRC